MTAFAALVPITEIFLYCLCIYSWLRRQMRPYPIPAALALGIISGLGLLSLLLQLAFLAGLPGLAPVLEVSFLSVLIGMNRDLGNGIRDMGTQLKTVWQDQPVAISLLGSAIAYLFLQAVLLPPSSWDALTYHLPRVLLWAQNQHLFLRDFIIAPQAAFPVGSDILFHLFLRVQTDYGLGIFSWLSYIAILFATYTLSRPRVNGTVALTTAIVVASLPEVVYQATATKNDIVLVAVALAAVVWADRWLRFPEATSLIGFGLTLCFGVAVKTSFVLFAAFFGVLWLTLVIQQAKGKILLQLLVQRWYWVAAMVPIAIVLSQSWLFLDNYRQFGSWLGPARFAIDNKNHQGWVGAIANLGRYSFQVVHLLAPIDLGWESMTGWKLTAMLQSVYDLFLDPLLGDAGRSQISREFPFKIHWQPQEDTSWFGPLGLFLVLPSMARCIVKSKELPRVMALVAVGITLVICYQIGWSPWKSRFFSIVFVLGGVCVAVCLPQQQRGLLRIIRAFSLIILCYACLYNVQKPLLLISTNSVIQQNIWQVSDWTRDRLIYDRLYAGNRIEAFNRVIPKGKTVAIVGYDHYFQFMFPRPDLTFRMLITVKATDQQRQSLAAIQPQLQQTDFLLCLLLPCKTEELAIELEPLLQNQPGEKVLEVYRILPQPN